MIVLNQARCVECGEIVKSLHVHDFKRCTCGKTAVDGGNDYLKRSCNDPGYIEMSLQIANPTKAQQALFGLLIAIRARNAHLTAPIAGAYLNGWKALEAESDTQKVPF